MYIDSNFIVVIIADIDVAVVVTLCYVVLLLKVTFTSLLDSYCCNTSK